MFSGAIWTLWLQGPEILDEQNEAIQNVLHQFKERMGILFPIQLKKKGISWDDIYPAVDLLVKKIHGPEYPKQCCGFSQR